MSDAMHLADKLRDEAHAEGVARGLGDLASADTHGRCADTVERAFYALDRQREAGCEAVGMLAALLEGGDIPACCQEQALSIVRKFNGTTQEKEST